MFKTHLTLATRVAGHSLFFPAAAAYAAALPLLSLAAMRGDLAGPPGIATPVGHAHELLFGFGLAVVAGFLLNRIDSLRLGILFALWLAARAGALVWPEGPTSALANAGFALYLISLTMPRLLGAAKKWRNKALAPTLIALALAVLAFHVADAIGLYGARYPTLHAGVLLFATLMLFMGGRIIAPAAAGHAQRRGRHLTARVQPRLEGALLVLMGLALVAELVPALQLPFSVLLLAAAAVASLRLTRWRLWWFTGRPDLLCLGVGYAWLAGGLALWGVSGLTGAPRAAAALHAITVGAMGTLTIAVMARTWLLKTHRDPAAVGEAAVGVAAVAVAAFLRLILPHHDAALTAAAVLWGLAYGLLLVFFARRPPGTSDHPAQPHRKPL